METTTDTRLLAAARAVLRLQLDSNLRNVDRKALGYAIAELHEAVQSASLQAPDETAAADSANRVPSVDSVWTRLSGE